MFPVPIGDHLESAKHGAIIVLIEALLAGIEPGVGLGVGLVYPVVDFLYPLPLPVHIGAVFRPLPVPFLPLLFPLPLQLQAFALDAISQLYSPAPYPAPDQDDQRFRSQRLSFAP